MRVRAVLIAGAFLLACAVPGLSFAQDNRVTSPIKPLSYPINSHEFLASMSASEREIYDLIEELLYVRLKNTLECDDATMVALASSCGQVKNQLTMLKWERAALREHLRWCLGVGLPDAGLQGKLNTLLDYELQIAQSLGEMVHGSESVIGTAGAAKLYLFVDDFERFLAKRIEEAIDTEKNAKGASLTASDSAVASQKPDNEADDAAFERFESLVRAENRDVPLSEFAGEDVIKLVDGLLMVRLAQALDLSREQSVKLFAHVGAHKDKLHELKWQIGGGREALRMAIASGAADGEIRKQLDDLLIQEQAVAKLMNDLVTGAGRDISVEQSAQLYLFLGDFEQYIIGLLERSAG